MFKAYTKADDPDVWYIVPHQSLWYRIVKWALAAPFLAAIIASVVYAVFVY